MTFTLFSPIEFKSILTPNGPIGWLIWFMVLGVAVWMAWSGRKSMVEWTRRDWIVLASLALFTPLFASLFVVDFPANILPQFLEAPDTKISVALLAALPWMLAGALLGSLPGAILAAFSAVILSSGEMSSPFAPLEFALLAAFFSIATRQGYRTRLFELMRKPILAALLLAVIYPLLFLFTSLFWAGESIAVGLDYAVSRIPMVSFSFALQLLIGGLVLESLVSREIVMVPISETSQASPFRRSLRTRFFATLGPVVLLLFLTLAGVVWIVAGRAARQMLSERMLNGSSVAASTVPLLLETGQNLILQLASEPALFSPNSFELNGYLGEHLNTVPYFEQYFLLGPSGETLAGYPVESFEGMQPLDSELEAIERAFSGVALQFFSIPPIDTSSDAAQLSFVASVNDGNRVRAVLLGRSRLATNPFAQPILDNLKSLTENGGQGLLLDGSGAIVFQPGGSSLLAPYSGPVFDGINLYEEIGLDGARQLVLYEPATGSGWSIVSQLPLSLVQQLALDIALPVFVLLLALAFLAYLLLSRSLRTVTASLQDLIVKSERIAAGDLDTALEIHHEDEVGSLGKSFERMRLTLRDRLEEIQRLLSVSQGISGSLEVQSQIEPILEAALASGAKLARLVFQDEGSEGAREQALRGFGLGEEHEMYQTMDRQILALVTKRKQVLLTNPGRARIEFGDLPTPQALAAFALQHKGEKLGVLWLAYAEPQEFGAEAIGYLQTLANQAASSALNARLYLQAEEGRQRLEALFETSTDPVFIADGDGFFVLANLSAQILLEKSSEMLVGVRIQDALEHEGLLEFLLSSPNGISMAELNFGEGRVFSATLSEIELDSGWRGRACILRETTQARQTEAKRAEFLATTSHELVDPLELVDGYLTMLDTVGNLNDKQSEYLAKTKLNIAGMSNLVRSLLDLERIDKAKGLQLESFSLVEVIDEVISEIGPRAVQKAVKIEMKPVADSMPMLSADRTLLQRAIYNLLDNGIKNSAHGKTVEIELEHSEEAVTVSIRDYGAGIASVDVPLVFDRVGDETGRSGVGLTIVKSIIERHNGKVWAESKLGTGSIFYAQLPLKQVH